MTYYLHDENEKLRNMYERQALEFKRERDEARAEVKGYKLAAAMEANEGDRLRARVAELEGLLRRVLAGGLSAKREAHAALEPTP